ncbi:metallophosphoesterase family protein [Bradyrhizobium sp. PMVTL-01]|uniref:metallophosphoesterase family protein n=1 Tax=Bradyrhizobium sp. PMVTL-01 TaxID=3434999 RepID=UPI003F70876D
MGFRLSLRHANWIAHILEPSGPTPQFENDSEERFALEALLRSARYSFYGTRPRHMDFDDALRWAVQALENGRKASEVLAPLIEFFRDRPWTALLIPSGDWNFDRFFSSSELLERLVHIRPDDPGLILQLEESIDEGRRVELDNVFPAFRVALANATKWPGVLVWTRTGDAAFFEVPAPRDLAFDRLEWIFSHLAVTYGRPDISLLLQQYARQMNNVRADVVPLRMLHLSDIHLGSGDAMRRLPRVKQLIQQLAIELGDDEPLVPVVTGDLMDTPDEAHLHAVRDFLEFLHSVGTDEPVVILGNHDVRKDGWLSAELQNAMRIQTDRVRWFDASRVGFACFNSVRGGRLACGSIDETEMLDVGQALDRQREKAQNYVLAGLLHHHPIPVERPDWYRQDWFERLLGKTFEKTDALENSEQFMSWLRARCIRLVLHGHKHIPRVEVHDGITVVGCGSTVGKVNTTEPGTTYMSINVVTIDNARGRISCRLRAERIPGGGLNSMLQHEAIMTGNAYRQDELEWTRRSLGQSPT